MNQTAATNPVMDYVIWGGAALTVIGVVGLVWCILLAIRARRAGLQGELMADALRRVTILNLGALAISGFGLMVVVVGVILK